MDWRQAAQRKLDRLPPEAKALREEAMSDLWVFAQLVNPGYMYGDIHKDIYRWMMNYNLFGRGEDLSSNKLSSVG